MPVVNLNLKKNNKENDYFLNCIQRQHKNCINKQYKTTTIYINNKNCSKKNSY